MSFRKLIKKSLKGKTKEHVSEKPNLVHASDKNYALDKNSVSPEIPQNESPKTSFKYRLYSKNADGLATLTSFFPFFAGAWLVSGAVLNQLQLVTMIFLPLLAIGLRSKLTREHKVPFLREMSLVLLVIIVLINLFIYDSYGTVIIPCLSILAATSYFLIENHKADSITSSLIRATSQAIFPATLSQLGVMSQTPINQIMTSENVTFVYLVLGFIPGTVLGAREIILAYPIFKKAGWKLSGAIITNSENKKCKGQKEVDNDESHQATKFKPGGFTRLALAFLLLGPIVPSLLLPFRILPETFLLSSLIFLVFPKIADMIQNQPEKYSLLSIHLTNLAALLAVLMFIAGLLAQVL